MHRKTPLGRAARATSIHAVAVCGVMLVMPFLDGVNGAAYGDETPPHSSAPSDAPGRVLIFRGVLNVFSLGLDDMAGDLQRKGYDVSIIPPSLGFVPAVHLREKYLADPQRRPLILIGHSMGGRMCLAVAKWLQKDNIPVELVLVLDANPNAKVPSNVKRCVNLYVTNALGIFHGSPLVPEDPRTPVLNIDVTRVKRPDWAWPVDHFNIDDSVWMRQVAINETVAACQRAPTMNRATLPDARQPRIAQQTPTLLTPVVIAEDSSPKLAKQPRLMAPVFPPSTIIARRNSPDATQPAPVPGILPVHNTRRITVPPMRFDANLRRSFGNIQAPTGSFFEWPQ